MSQYCGEDLSIKYERNNNISYAVVDITDSNELVEYEMKMLMRNEIMIIFFNFPLTRLIQENVYIMI